VYINLHFYVSYKNDCYTNKGS